MNSNRRFPEITGKDNLTVFSYSGRVKSPEWRRQRRRADLRQFQIFRHGPIIISTRLPAGGTYYPICMFPTNSERLIGISDAFSAFVSGYPSSCPRAHCTPNKSVTTPRYTRRHGPVYTGHACRHLPSAVPWISEDRLIPVYLLEKHNLLSFFKGRKKKKKERRKKKQHYYTDFIRWEEACKSAFKMLLQFYHFHNGSRWPTLIEGCTV